MASKASDDFMQNWASVQETLGGSKRRAMKALVTEYMSLLKEPVEGFVVRVEDPFNWDVGIYGPPSTPYWGGYFKVHVSFPDEYPFEPPKMTFKSRFWHPNVYQNGVVCMSILHDPRSEDFPSDLPTEEKWNPTLSVRTVLLSLISIIGTPNPDSPANVDATKMYRSWMDGEDDSYSRIIQDIVVRSKKTAERDGVSVPTTLDEYLKKPEPEKLSLVDYQDDDSVYGCDSSDSSSFSTWLASDSESTDGLFLDTGETPDPPSAADSLKRSTDASFLRSEAPSQLEIETRLDSISSKNRDVILPHSVDTHPQATWQAADRSADPTPTSLPQSRKRRPSSSSLLPGSTDRKKRRKH